MLIRKKSWVLCAKVEYFIFERQTFNNVKVTQETKNTYQYSKKVTSIYPNIELLNSGDIILRRGYGVDSIVAARITPL